MELPTLVLLHGYPFDHSMWDGVIAALDLNARVLAPDLRGFGGTPVGTEAPSIEIMARDVKQLVEREQIERPVVCGFSMGGYVALAFAELYPKLIAGLGLINSQPAADSDEARNGRRRMIEKVKAEGPDSAVAAALPKLFSPTNRHRPDLAAKVQEGAHKAGIGGIAWALEAMARRPDRSSVLRQLTVPWLSFHTEEDQFIPIARARALADQFPYALHVEAKQAGHASPLEAPEKVAKAIGELWRRAGEADDKTEP